MKYIFVTILAMLSMNIMSQSAEWADKQYKISGDWEIIEKEGKNVLIIKENFITPNGPDLKLYITPTDISTVQNRDNVQSFDGVFIDDILHKGEQTFILPDVNLGGYEIADYPLYAIQRSMGWREYQVKNTHFSIQ